jgi:hypothetical protein
MQEIQNDFKTYNLQREEVFDAPVYVLGFNLSEVFGGDHLIGIADLP